MATSPRFSSSRRMPSAMRLSEGRASVSSLTRLRRLARACWAMRWVARSSSWPSMGKSVPAELSRLVGLRGLGRVAAAAPRRLAALGAVTVARRLGLGLAGSLGSAAVVGGVEAGTLEVDGHRVQHLVDAGPAKLTGFYGFVGEFLEELE